MYGAEVATVYVNGSRFGVLILIVVDVRRRVINGNVENITKESLNPYCSGCTAPS